MKGALQGIKVLDLSRLLPGPYCSMILADHGADVLRLEARRFAADPFPLHTLQRNKRHISLDLKTDEGREIFYRLACGADVVLEGFRPGVADRLGVGYAALRDVNRRHDKLKLEAGYRAQGAPDGPGAGGSGGQ